MAKKKVIIKDVIDEFKEVLPEVAKNLGKDTDDVTAAEFLAESGMNYSHLKSAGGFTNLRKMHFPEKTNNKVKHGATLAQSFRNKMGKKEGLTEFISEQMTSVLKEHLKENPIKLHKPLKAKGKSKKKQNRTIVAHWSDSHFGANIDKSEVQINEYNWTIAARRLALFVEQICNYKKHYRSETDLVFCINGDIIAGMIHDQEWFADLLVYQYAGTVSLLAQAITFLAQNYKSVSVECAPGNHGRAMHKSGKDRATTHKFDSYETMIYIALKETLKGHDNISVKVPKTPYAIFKAQGHNFFMTHGDTVINVGNPGKSLNMKEINGQINKLNASELGGDDKFEGLIVGHVHTPTIQLTESGCMLIINGCSSGIDPFGQAIGIFSSNPTQQLFEVTPEHSVGDMRFIQLKAADDRKDLDKIIEPYNVKLEEF